MDIGDLERQLVKMRMSIANNDSIDTSDRTFCKPIITNEGDSLSDVDEHTSKEKTVSNAFDTPTYKK